MRRDFGQANKLDFNQSSVISRIQGSGGSFLITPAGSLSLALSSVQIKPDSIAYHGCERNDLMRSIIASALFVFGSVPSGKSTGNSFTSIVWTVSIVTQRLITVMT